MTTPPEGYVRSANGSTIAFESTGAGPALILIEAAAHHRAFSSFTGLTQLDSDGTTDDLSGWASQVAARLPNATHRSLAGEWHGLADDVLAPVLVEFFTASADETP